MFQLIHTIPPYVRYLTTEWAPTINGDFGHLSSSPGAFISNQSSDGTESASSDKPAG